MKIEYMLMAFFGVDIIVTILGVIKTELSFKRNIKVLYINEDNYLRENTYLRKIIDIRDKTIKDLTGSKDEETL
jgi:hypothetical protein